MQTFDLAELLAQRTQSDQAYLEFLRAPALSMGIYHLQSGAPDLQRPHTEDEVYYVLSGRARFQSAGEQVEVQPGTLLYVPKGVEHRFLDISKDLSVLVFFAPTEGSED